jgi:hypothetical protein
LGLGDTGRRLLERHLVTIMRRPPFSTVRLATLLAVVTSPACFSLPHVDPGNRVIADFAEQDAGLNPTWSRFDGWTCSAYVDPSPPRDGGQDGGGFGSGDVDAGQAFTCTPQLAPGSADPSAPATGQHLVASFNITTTDHPLDVDVATATKSGPVNLAGFSQFIFDAKLGPTSPGAASLPAGTELKVELRCSGISPYDPLVDQDFTLLPGATSWKPITLPLSSFLGPPRCLAAVDGIGFVLVPGSAQAGTQIGGVLELDNIELH